MTEDERIEKFDLEYSLIADLTEAYHLISKAANEFECAANRDEDGRFGDWQEEADYLNEYAKFNIQDRIESIAWQIQDRRVLEDMHWDTSWWDESSTEQLDEWLGKRVVVRAIDCE